MKTFKEWLNENPALVADVRRLVGTVESEITSEWVLERFYRFLMATGKL